MLSIFASPSRYVQGRGATAALGAEMVGLGLGGPVLVVAGRSAESMLADAWAESFRRAGLAHVVHRFGGECSRAEIARVVEAARATGARTIAGAGGGKAVDTGRASAHELGLPFVSCPSLASSDAPCSAISVVYSEDGRVEDIRFLPRNPDLVVVDTEVVAKSPVRFLVAGMGDAAATWFEARACAQSHARNTRGGAATRSALALAELCWRTLVEDGEAARRSVESHAVTPALERLVEANTLLSGLGFESAGLAAAHAIHNGLTEAPGTHGRLHGEKVAFGLCTQLALEGAPRATVEEVLGFATAVGLPVTLAEIGLAELDPAMLRRIAERSTQPGESIHNEPFAVEPASVADAILAADAEGRAFLARAGRR